MEYRSVHYAYGDAVSLLDRLLGRSVHVSIDGEPGYSPPAAAALFGTLGRWKILDEVAELGKDFEQEVVAFFSVASSDAENTRQGPITSFALSQTRFIDAERLLVPGERKDSVTDGGCLAIRLGGGIVIDVTWHALSYAN